MDSWIAEQASPLPVHGRKSLAKKNQETKTLPQQNVFVA
jgi:hypothetical protein